MQDQETDNKSSERMQEIKLALSIQQRLMAVCDSEYIHNAVNLSLKGMLEATKIEEFDLYRNRMVSLLDELSRYAPPEHQEGIVNALNEVAALAKIRHKYLHNLFSYLQLWAEEKWPGLNLVFLIIPYIVGIVVPILGTATLIFSSILTGIDFLDFGRQSQTYWNWDDAPSDRKPSLSAEEISTLNNNEHYKNLNIVLDTPPTKISNVLYASYAIALAISLIGLASFIFPPIGIPALALTILTVVAIFAAGTQAKIVYSNRRQQLAAIQELKETIKSQISDDSNHMEAILFKHVDSSKVVPTSFVESSYVVSSNVGTTANWLTDPLRNWFKPKTSIAPRKDKIDPETEHTPSKNQSPAKFIQAILDYLSPSSGNTPKNDLKK